MSHAIVRTVIAAGALLLQSANAPADDLILRKLAHQANELKPYILGGRATVLTNSCPEGWRLKDDAQNCALVLKVIINEFEDQGYFGRYICPPARTEHSKLFDMITDHVVVQKPTWAERAVYVALDALMRKYPCDQTTRPKIGPKSLSHSAFAAPDAPNNTPFSRKAAQ